MSARMIPEQRAIDKRQAEHLSGGDDVVRVDIMAGRITHYWILVWDRDGQSPSGWSVAKGQSCQAGRFRTAEGAAKAAARMEVV